VSSDGVSSAPGGLRLVPPRGAGDPAWRALRAQLWPEESPEEHLRGMADALARRHYVRLALTADGAAAGFVEASQRVDYVNGTSSSPVAFLEGLYVAPGSRGQGLARALVESVRLWAEREGCRELASDCLADNSSAHAVHRALGFEETERVVYFRRTVRAPP